MLLILAGAWLALGLLEARQDLQVGGGGVRSELARPRPPGRPARISRRQAVRAAERSLEVAATVPDRRELRIVANLPLLSRNADDTRRLLAELAAELERTRGPRPAWLTASEHLRYGGPERPLSCPTKVILCPNTPSNPPRPCSSWPPPAQPAGPAGHPAHGRDDEQDRGLAALRAPTTLAWTDEIPSLRRVQRAETVGALLKSVASFGIWTLAGP